MEKVNVEQDRDTGIHVSTYFLNRPSGISFMNLLQHVLLCCLVFSGCHMGRINGVFPRNGSPLQGTNGNVSYDVFTAAQAVIHESGFHRLFQNLKKWDMKNTRDWIQLYMHQWPPVIFSMAYKYVRAITISFLVS